MSAFSLFRKEMERKSFAVGEFAIDGRRTNSRKNREKGKGKRKKQNLPSLDLTTRPKKKEGEENSLFRVLYPWESRREGKTWQTD